MCEDWFLYICTQTQIHISPFTEQENQENTKKKKVLKKKGKNNKEEYTWLVVIFSLSGCILGNSCKE